MQAITGSAQSKAQPRPAAPPVEVPTTRAEFLDAAQRWASNAYNQAKSVRGELRTEECDEACAAALCTMGDILAMMGKEDQARARFQASRNLALKHGVKEVAQVAAKRVKELDAKHRN